MNSKPLISRRRHYLYVLVFSVAAWLFAAELIGGFVPVKYGYVGKCECELHNIYMNISFLVYGIGGIIAGLVFSYPLNRWMLVANSKPDDREVPVSKLARYGKGIFGWKGLFLALLISCLYICGNFITHKVFFTHKTEKVKQEDKIVLHCAAARGDYDEVSSELEKNPDIINSNTCYWTPLLLAVKFGHKDIAALLLDKGADINGTGHGSDTPLFEAVSNNHKDIALLLIDKGADVNAKGFLGLTPLHIAARFGREDVTVLLLERGADVNVQGYEIGTPLDLPLNDKIKSLLRAHGGKTGEELKASRVKRQESGVDKK